jgi:hypothetical protein
MSEEPPKSTPPSAPAEKVQGKADLRKARIDLSW